VFLVFLVLKLTGHIAWSWWWVTAPLWGGAVAMLALMFAAVALAAVSELATKKAKRTR
jgi:hypothetical protein